MSCDNEKACKANYIAVEWAGITTIGAIIDVEYINDSNTRISYVVDAFMSANVSGLIEKMQGLCERTNLVDDARFVNLQPEPFSPSDNMQVNTVATVNFNKTIEVFENVTPSAAGIGSNEVCFILTVSPAIIEFTGATAFSTPSSVAKALKPKSDLSFYAADSTVHGGGVFRGTPLRFETMDKVQSFIKDILGGCGFCTNLPVQGYSIQNLAAFKPYITDQNTGAGQAYFQEGNYTRVSQNIISLPLQSVRFITINDIYNLYCLPKAFAIDRQEFFTFNISHIAGFKDFYSLHKFGTESERQYKLISHPYYYCKIVTANGDTVNIIPQTDFLSSSIVSTVNLVLRFIGGDTPRLMGLISKSAVGVVDPYSHAAAGDWFTVRNYPAVTLSINDSYNPQNQHDSANIRRAAANYANARTSQSISSPIKQAYLDTVSGNNRNNSSQSAWGQIKGTFGAAMGHIDNLAPAGKGRNLFSDVAGAGLQNDIRSMTAGNNIEAAISTIMGNDFSSQFGIPAVSCYDCGATDAELFGFSRYLEEFGATCNAIINPLDDSGDILGGQSRVVPFEGKTFYQFANINIKGVMPVEWKNNIKNLFESGVYLI